MSLKTLNNIIRSYRKVYRNYIGTLFTLYIRMKVSRMKDIKIKVLLKNRKSLVVPYGWVTSYARLMNIENSNIQNLELTNLGITFQYKGKKVTIDPARFSDPDAVFFREEYRFLKVKDKDVIDIGMNIGDSSIYFSLNGAERVIGLEPYLYAFLIANKNVSLNNIDNIITLNAGYGKDQNVIVNSEYINNTGSSLAVSEKGKEISIFSLKTLINKYNIAHIVLKMDCEGCEYALLNEDDLVFKSIEAIQIEYHYGYENLVSKLKGLGFDVKYTEPKHSFNPDAENPNMELGYIYAKRRT